MRTDYGFSKLAACEFLNCSLSELPKRCPEIPDYHAIVAYLARRAELEKAAIKREVNKKCLALY